jgi:hypothetical protein
MTYKNPAHHPIGGDCIGCNSVDRCAVRWLLDRSPGRWAQSDSGWTHTSYLAACDRYGEAFLRRIAEMSDTGVPWVKIAAKIQRRERVRALLRSLHAIPDPVLHPVGAQNASM